MSNYGILEFPIEVIAELKHYVYRLIDPRNGETFYVGKGQGNRVFQHIKCIKGMHKFLLYLIIAD